MPGRERGSWPRNRKTGTKTIVMIEPGFAGVARRDGAGSGDATPMPSNCAEPHRRSAEIRGRVDSVPASASVGMDSLAKDVVVYLDDVVRS